MKKKHWISDYLTLSRKERIGILLLGVLVLTLFLLPTLLPRNTGKSTNQADTAWIKAMKMLEKKQARENRFPVEGNERSSYSENHTPSDSFKKEVLFLFDPNTLNAEDWQRLGVREKTIKTILNYVSKGGKFRKPEDLQRIYGLFPDEYERLAPFIRINASGENDQAGRYAEKAASEIPSTNSFSRKLTELEINSADTSDFIALPGIGSRLAGRIVHFREKLGGFYSITQVGETFGLADSVFRLIKPLLKLGTPSLRKININTATAEELRSHPYLKWNIIHAMLAYRMEHGPFRRKEELKQVMAVSDELYERIAPYLVTE